MVRPALRKALQRHWRKARLLYAKSVAGIVPGLCGLHFSGGWRSWHDDKDFSSFLRNNSAAERLWGRAKRIAIEAALGIG